jgi:hypothetical protein
MKKLLQSLGVAALAIPTSILILQKPATADTFPNRYANPLYGSTNFSSGITSSPLIFSVMAGGDTNAYYLGIGNNCNGFIASDQPDFRLNYQASYSGRRQLVFDAYSNSDTTLVISGPNNFWYCNDDFNGSLNPHIMVDSPQSGQYDIWVGNFSMNSPSNAQLQITEVNNLPDSPYPPSIPPGPSSQIQRPPINQEVNSNVIWANALGTLLGAFINGGSQNSTTRVPQPQPGQVAVRTPVVTQNRGDSLNQMLADYGLTRVPCIPGKVFITGISNDAICVEPTYNLPAGNYQYDSATQQFVFYP